MSLIAWKFLICNFRSLIMSQIPENSPFLIKQRKMYQNPSTNCSWNLSNINFWPKVNIQNITYRNLLNLKFFRNWFCLYSSKSLTKASNLLKILDKKILSFEGDWAKLLAKIWFYRPSVTKYFSKTKKINEKLDKTSKNW